MKLPALVIPFIMICSCNSGEPETETTKDSVSAKQMQNNSSAKSDTGSSAEAAKKEDEAPISKSADTAKTYANARFKDVRVQRTGDHSFTITGRGQIFEAAFSWIVEDGHDEIKKGFEMTDAGAPEWGKFKFTVNVEKKRPNSTLHLVLFEVSAKDGSRQHQLPLLLY